MAQSAVFRRFSDRRRPHNNHSIPHKLDNIPSVLHDYLDESFCVAIHAEGKLFGSSGALLGTFFRYFREATRMRENEYLISANIITVFIGCK